MSEQARALLGADPEVFVVKGKRPIPIFGLVGGTKAIPLPMRGLPEGFFFQEDGAALEFNIPPAADAVTFTNNITAALKWMEENLLRPNGLLYAKTNRIVLEAEQQRVPAALEIGCSADHYAWDQSLAAMNFQRQPFTAANLGGERYAGCHFHLAYNVESDATPEIMAQFMDLAVGTQAICTEADASQHGRRRFYGLAGLYRPKSYGIEYRTLSSNILIPELTPAPKKKPSAKDPYYEPEKLSYVKILARSALDLGNWTYTNMDLLYTLHAEAPWHDVRRSIEEEDMQVAREVNDWFQYRVSELTR